MTEEAYWKRLHDAALNAADIATEREVTLDDQCKELQRTIREQGEEWASLRAKLKEPTPEMIAAAQAFIRANKGVGFDDNEFARRALIAGNAKA